MLRKTCPAHAGAGRKGAHLSSLLTNLISLFSPLYAHGSLPLQYIALWTFVPGAALVCTMIYLRRNARARATARTCEKLQNRIQQILRHSREILYGFDLQRRTFDYLSPACFSRTGYTEEELRAMSSKERFDHIHPDDQDKIRRLIRKLCRREGQNEWLGVVEYRFRHREGQYRFFSDHLCVRYAPTGEPLSLCGSVREVTQIARLEESLRILERKFQDEQKMAGLGLLAGGIAHDFNNLMTVVLGNTELALLGCGGSNCGVLDEIKKTTLRAAELAHQMLVYTGKTAQSTEIIHLDRVVREMGALLEVSISKKVRLQYSLAENIRSFRGDISQIRQVVMNLITNASEAIGDRSGVIAISIQNVELKAGQLEKTFPGRSASAGRYVRLEVSDTGAGMREETMQKIFDPLFTTKVTGRGLGLATLLNAVERHNGTVEVQSNPGQGTVFRVYFPAEEGQGSGVEAAALRDEPREWRGNGTVLVADDEPAIQAMTRALLERVGFRVLTASDGMEAVDLCTEHAEEITLLLIDINMPRLSGMEAVLRIRYTIPRIPVLFMSGYSRDEVMGRFGRQPHTDFVQKPFRSDDLVSAIRRVMEPG